MAALAERLSTEPPPTLDDLASLQTGSSRATGARDEFLDLSASRATREATAALIVHLLSRNPHLLDAEPIAERKRVLAFIDDALQRSYGEWNVNATGEDFQRAAALAGLMAQTLIKQFVYLYGCMTNLIGDQGPCQANG